MNSDDATRDMRGSFKVFGIGMTSHFSCLGCGKLRTGLGSKGKGINKRCAECVAKKKVKKA